MKILKLYLALVLCAGMVGCEHDPGYHRLMRDLGKRAWMHTCEHLELDGDTCYTIQDGSNPAPVVCGKTRDGAAKKTAEYIEKNVAEDGQNE